MAQQVSEKATELTSTIAGYLKNKWQIRSTDQARRTIHLTLQKGKQGIDVDPEEFIPHDLMDLLDSIQDYFSSNEIRLIGFPRNEEKYLSFEFASPGDFTKAVNLLKSFMPQKEKGGRT